MRNWAIVSIISRFLAQTIGVVQSVVIIKIVSVNDYGLIGLVGSIVAILGVTQSLGISSGATREIAATDNRKDAFKVFLGSLVVRYSITIPLITILFFIAPYLGYKVYHRPDIIFPLRIFAVTIMVESAQSVLNSVIQGLKRFKFLFTFQVGIAFISLMIFVPFVLRYKFLGYYYATFFLQVVWTSIMVFYVFKLFKGSIDVPTKRELIRIIKAVFSIGIFVYITRILYTLWQKMGPAIVARHVSGIELGIFTFALFVSAKIIMISDAITDVTLPSMTTIYERQKDKFFDIFKNVNSKSLILITVASVGLIFFKKDAFLVVDYIFAFVGKNPITPRYESSFSLMTPMIVGFWAYSLINLLRSGYSVPIKRMWQVLFVYIMMLVLTGSLFYSHLLNMKPMPKFAYSLMIGAILSWLLYLTLNQIFIRKLIITFEEIFIILFSGTVIWLYSMNMLNKYILFAVYAALSGIFYWYSYYYKNRLVVDITDNKGNENKVTDKKFEKQNKG